MLGTYNNMRRKGSNKNIIRRTNNNMKQEHHKAEEDYNQNNNHNNDDESSSEESFGPTAPPPVISPTTRASTDQSCMKSIIPPASIDNVASVVNNNNNNNKEAKKKSLKVQLISVVDLPKADVIFPRSTIQQQQAVGSRSSNNMFHVCPIFKFGIRRRGDESIPKGVEDLIGDDAKDDNDETNFVKSYGDISSVPSIRDVRFSVRKPVVTESDNCAAEWHEEIVWDDCISNDREILVQLSYRMPPLNKNVDYWNKIHSEKEAELLSMAESKEELQRGAFEEPPLHMEESVKPQSPAWGRAALDWGRNVINRRRDEVRANERRQAAANIAKEMAPENSKNITTSQHKGNYDVPDKPKNDSDYCVAYGIIPLSRLFDMQSSDNRKIEQWIPLSSFHKYLGQGSSRRLPSVLLEISIVDTEDTFSKATGVLENDIESHENSIGNLSSRSMGKQNHGMYEIKEDEIPILVPGVIDYVAVIGSDGLTSKHGEVEKGWLPIEPKSKILEQFPPTKFYEKHQRSVEFPQCLDWFCFPEGIKIWSGKSPPTHHDLESHFSVSSDPSIERFDMCLSSACSFSWFVVASNDGVQNNKTYGAAVRFYCPAPGVELDAHESESNKLWVPLAVCLTSSLPIVGILEAILLRFFESVGTEAVSWGVTKHHKELISLILNAPAPIPDVIHTSVPFLNGERFHVTLPPKAGLPPLPHGSCISETCRLLGPSGIVTLLSAVLTECKILLHSSDSANLAMVAETLSALIYPFHWHLPYIPVLPKHMYEFIEAPLSYLIGLPSCMMKHLKEETLADVVVVNLNLHSNKQESYQEIEFKSKTPTFLPPKVADEISHAVDKLLYEEGKMVEEYGRFSTDHLPRLDQESLAERKFRIKICTQMCSLIDGYEECLFYVSKVQPVFNRERFLSVAPVLYETKYHSSSDKDSRQLSKRSKRFLSLLVHTQHFHQLLEIIDDSNTFFHEVLTALGEFRENKGVEVEQSFQEEKLSTFLQDIEDKIPTYRTISKKDESLNNDKLPEIFKGASIFSSPSQGLTFNALQVETTETNRVKEKTSHPTSWKYKKVFDLNELEPDDHEILNTSKENWSSLLTAPVSLEQALDHENFQKYKENRTKNAKMPRNAADQWSNSNFLDISGDNLDCKHSYDPPLRQKIESIRICLQRAYTAEMPQNDEREPDTEFPVLADSDIFIGDGGVDLIQQAEVALREVGCQLFLIDALSHHNVLVRERQKRFDKNSFENRKRGSRLVKVAYECLVRLCNAMLKACYEVKGYRLAYRLLTQCTEFYTIKSSSLKSAFQKEECEIIETLTDRIATHPVYMETGMWEKVFDMQKNGVSSPDNLGESSEIAYYDAAVSTLYQMGSVGIVSDELSRFAKILSEKCNWLSTERDHALQLLVTSISQRNRGNDIPSRNSRSMVLGAGAMYDSTEVEYDVVRWTHPSDKKNKRRLSLGRSGRSRPQEEYRDEMEPLNFYGRTAVTAMVNLGSSVVATGDVDGSIFLAYNPLKTGEVNGSRVQFENSPGSVICLAAIHSSVDQAVDIDGDDNDFKVSLAGCKVVGGTSSGACKVFSLQDLYIQSFVYGDARFERRDFSAVNTTGIERIDGVIQRGVRVAELRQNLRGQNLSSHYGGVTTMEVPSSIFRPNTVLTAGADGMIKCSVIPDRMISGQELDDEGSLRSAKSGGSASIFFSKRNANEMEPLFVLAGHGGRINCLQSAWHGDQLISGGADSSMRLWDIDGSCGQCSRVFTGHTGWVTSCRFFGKHSTISGSSDRTVRIWDLRSEKASAVILHHKAPISSFMTESRVDNIFASSSGDGSIMLWDLRKLWEPVLNLNHGEKINYSGSTLITKGTSKPEEYIISAGVDGILREWNIKDGSMLDEVLCSTSDISFLKSFTKYDNLSKYANGNDRSLSTGSGSIVCSWDGNVTLRRKIGPK